MIYLDHNATTPVLPEVLEAMMPFFTTEWGNPSSSYKFGSKLKKVIETAREQVLRFAPRAVTALRPILRLVRNDEPNSTTRVWHVAVVTRDDVHVKLRNCLPGCWPIVQADIEAVGLRLKRELEMRDAPVNPSHQPHLLIGVQIAEPRDNSLDDD